MLFPYRTLCTGLLLWLSDRLEDNCFLGLSMGCIASSRLILTITASAVIVGCAHTSVHWLGDRPIAPVARPVFVLVLPGPALPPDSAGFSARLLDIVREFDSKAEQI